MLGMGGGGVFTSLMLTVVGGIKFKVQGGEKNMNLINVTTTKMIALIIWVCNAGVSIAANTPEYSKIVQDFSLCLPQIACCLSYKIITHVISAKLH